MSDYDNDYAESLRRDEHTELQKDAINWLEKVIAKFEDTSYEEDVEKAYWQGKKDGARTAVSMILNEPSVDNLNAFSRQKHGLE